MIRVPRAVPPWSIELSTSERDLVLYVIIVAAFALAVTLTRFWSARSEVGDRYRPAVHAGVGAVLVAFLSYVLLLVELEVGYDFRGGAWVPNADSVGTWAARYMDWTVSVPLLVIELIAVSALTGSAARRARLIGVTAAAAMSALGYLGGVVVGDGRSFGALLGFGLASSACFVVLDAVVIGVVLRSLPVLPAAARRPLRSAMLVLIVTWFVYPVVFGLQGVVSGGWWTAAAHVALCAADVTAKVVFGLLLLRVARTRTAADVLAGEDVHPEGIWIDQLRQSAGVAARPGRDPQLGD